ncbi:hypothetical protein ACQBAR_02255 [Propionibacteriaceae bacterium Y1685]|uniref:hypothetical protein n=1 Tax=Microlunatus sp. Y1700 TaxID=3418487 RepID=UPI003B7A4942
MRFDGTSWKKAAAEFAEVAESVGNDVEAKMPSFKDLARAGLDGGRTTLVDDAISAIVPESVDAVWEVLRTVVDGLNDEASAMYMTGDYYIDVEAENEQNAAKVEESLGQTPFNR